MLETSLECPFALSKETHDAAAIAFGKKITSQNGENKPKEEPSLKSNKTDKQIKASYRQKNRAERVSFTKIKKMETPFLRNSDLLVCGVHESETPRVNIDLSICKIATEPISIIKATSSYASIQRPDNSLLFTSSARSKKCKSTASKYLNKNRRTEARTQSIS